MRYCNRNNYYCGTPRLKGGEVLVHLREDNRIFLFKINKLVYFR